MVATVVHLNIVLVEDHEVLRGLLADALTEAGHRVTALACAEAMEDETGGELVDVFLVDVNLPGEDGFSLTRRLRAAYPAAAIILMTARSGLKDKVEGYDSGADLYLPKPFEAEELCAAVAAFGRRKQRLLQLDETLAGLTLHQQQLRLSVEGSGHEAVSLTGSELAMLVALARAPSQRLAYWQLAELLGMELDAAFKASLEVRIVRLRKKIAAAGMTGKSIEVVRGYGYQLCQTLQVL